MSKAEQKTAATFLYVRFRANTAKYTAKAGKVQTAGLRIATHYISRAFLLYPFLLKQGWGGEAKKMN